MSRILTLGADSHDSRMNGPDPNVYVVQDRETLLEVFEDGFAKGFQKGFDKGCLQGLDRGVTKGTLHGQEQVLNRIGQGRSDSHGTPQRQGQGTVFQTE